MSGYYPKKNDRIKLGSKHLKHGDRPTTSMDITDVDTTQNQTESVDDLLRQIMSTASSYMYPREGKVPAGFYFSTVAELSAHKKRLSNGGEKLMLDVFYDIEGCDYKNRGMEYKILQSYAPNTPYIQSLFGSALSAGIQIDPQGQNLIGFREKIKLAYVSDRSDIGSIVDRVPYMEMEEPNEEANDGVTDDEADDDDDDFEWLDLDD